MNREFLCACDKASCCISVNKNLITVNVSELLRETTCALTGSAFLLKLKIAFPFISYCIKGLEGLTFLCFLQFPTKFNVSFCVALITEIVVLPLTKNAIRSAMSNVLLKKVSVLERKCISSKTQNNIPIYFIFLN